MRIERHYTNEGQSPYEAVRFRTATSEIRNPDGSIVFRLDDIQVPAAWSQVATDVLAQKYFRKAGVPARLKKIEENSVPSFLWRSEADTQRSPPSPRRSDSAPRRRRAAGLRPARRHLDLLGLEGRLLLLRGRRARVLRRAPLHARDAEGGAELAAMVQHRPALGLRHRRAEPGPLLRRPLVEGAGEVAHRLRAPAAARLLHPVRLRRPRQRGRHHGPLGARGAPLQIRLRHRLELFAPARRRRAAVRRRKILRPDELSEDRRPRGGRHQVGRHDAPRRQDGGGRRRPSRHRELHQLEGEGGAEGRRARRRLESLRKAPLAHHEGLRELRRPGRRLLRSAEEPGAEARDPRRQEGERAGELYPPRHPVRQAGLLEDRVPDLRPRLGFGSLPHRLRPELQQLGARHRRVPARGGRGQGLEPHVPHHRKSGEDAPAARALGRHRLRRLGVGRSRHPVPHDDQRLAHLPRRRRDHRLEPVLRVHVPRRHGLQSRLAEPSAVPQGRGRRRSTPSPTSMPSASGRSCSRSPC